MITVDQNREQLVREEIYHPAPVRERWQIQSEKQFYLTAGPASTDTDILNRFAKTVDRNFQDWIFKKQAGRLKYTEEQVQWLRMIKDYIANSFRVDKDDFELDPFNKQGGWVRCGNCLAKKRMGLLN